MTKREMFEAIKNVEGVSANPEFVEFLDKQIELVSKKRNTKTKTQIENEAIVEDIYEVMVATNGPVKIADLMANEKFAGMTNQKLSSLVKKLVDANKVERAKDGKVTIYTVID